MHLWRKVSLAVNPDIRLFDDGTDPDDVRRGAFADSWLLSALSIISAASIGDGGVDEQVHRRQVEQRKSTPHGWAVVPKESWLLTIGKYVTYLRPKTLPSTFLSIFRSQGGWLDFAVHSGGFLSIPEIQRTIRLRIPSFS